MKERGMGEGEMGDVEIGMEGGRVRGRGGGWEREIGEMHREGERWRGGGTEKEGERGSEGERGRERQRR